MSKALKTVHVAPGSELDRLLEEAAGADILLEKEGVQYRLNRIQTPDTGSTIPWQVPKHESERILNIVGIGESLNGSDITRYKDRYIADAVDDRGE